LTASSSAATFGLMGDGDDRRAFLSLAGASLCFAAVGCGKRDGAAEAVPLASAVRPNATTSTEAAPNAGGEDVGAVEDLMREHGVIRRVLVVYREIAPRLRKRAASVPLDALQKAATLLRTFGENYHETQLEEAHIFPAVKNAGGAAASLVDVLVAQHRRGREITEYVLTVARAGVGSAQGVALAGALESFARMYEEHAAQEDTIVFPAWKKALSAKQLDEMGDLFEDIERETFGKDGFDDAAAQAAAIETALGIELASLTAPPPPRA
jgi:hemerythrin-like domain-containing protein